MGVVLGSRAGSVTTHVSSRLVRGKPVPKVGMGVTLLGWVDRYAGTIISIESGVISVQEDRATRADTGGTNEYQSYDYAPDPEGMIHHYRHRRGSWEPVRHDDRSGRWQRREGYDLRIGVRDHYYDFSF
jgi:hypothetical protein